MIIVGLGMATRQEDKGKGKESSSSKEHVDTEKQERYKLPSLSDKGKQKEHVTLEDPTIHPAPPESQTSYTSYLDISVHNSPYLEAGVARHPQVLEWLNTRKQRRVFASSFFSLFAEVTRLLRTTRRDELSHDDRHYITQCCNSLEAVGFDASWLSYVGGCMKECDEAEAEMEMVKSSLEETEAKASTLKAQIVSMKNELASVEASLVLLHHKASKLHDFIES
ncbi:uncharacterized protein G2W53_040483 [Senna tora]|uniref:Uncharacterized protein n=1 Tax=Senna tora TaxID=362788 RepID=A0A834SDK2_9FABA|nr:uncharacterized protein G2W53_040483 [Senna tora]